MLKKQSHWWLTLYCEDYIFIVTCRFESKCLFPSLQSLLVLPKTYTTWMSTRQKCGWSGTGPTAMEEVRLQAFSWSIRKRERRNGRSGKPSASLRLMWLDWKKERPTVSEWELRMPLGSADQTPLCLSSVRKNWVSYRIESFTLDQIILFLFYSLLKLEVDQYNL